MCKNIIQQRTDVGPKATKPTELFRRNFGKHIFNINQGQVRLPPSSPAKQLAKLEKAASVDSTRAPTRDVFGEGLPVEFFC